MEQLVRAASKNSSLNVHPLNKQHLLPYSSRDQNSKIKELARLISEVFFSGLHLPWERGPSAVSDLVFPLYFLCFPRIGTGLKRVNTQILFSIEIEVRSPLTPFLPPSRPL